MACWFCHLVNAQLQMILSVGLVVYLPARMAEVQEVRSQNRGVATLFVFQLRLILFQLFFVLC